MLATFVRGIVLIGVVGWYSAHLWKAVDSYFKSQFQRYLDDEYQRNPRMRDDVRTYATADKSEHTLTDLATETQRILEACERETCPIDQAESARGEEEKSVPALTVDEARKEVAGATEPPAAFRDSPVALDTGPPEVLPVATVVNIVEHPVVSSKVEGEMHPEMEVHQDEMGEKPLSRIEHDSPNPKSQQNGKQPQEELHEKQKKPKHEQKRPKPSSQGKRISKAKFKIAAKTEKWSKRRRNIREEMVQQLSYTREDYDRHAWERRFMGRERNDYRDFVEFEDETDRRFDETDKDDDGIPISALPFKPAIDIYDLDWISANEFCPLTLEEGATCDETRSWG